MINLTIRLHNIGVEVDLHTLDDLLRQAGDDRLDIMSTVNNYLRYSCIDIEADVPNKAEALLLTAEMIDYASVGDYVKEIEIED